MFQSFFCVVVVAERFTKHHFMFSHIVDGDERVGYAMQCSTADYTKASFR